MSIREKRIASLEERLRQLKIYQQRAEARRRHVEGKRERRADLRRKILVGAVVLGLVEQGKLAERDLRAWLDQAIESKDERTQLHL